ncbi:MAG: sodium:calcium antiporter [Candidatus Methylomirabilia bacterium]
MTGEFIQAVLVFLGSAALVIFGGIYLARYGDALAELTGWGRLWVGTILVAVATSLPELVVNISAVRIDAPELAIANIFGANMVNMFTLAMVALVFGSRRFFSRLAPEQAILAAVAIFLTGTALFLGLFPPGVAILHVGLGSFLVLAAYLGGMRLVYLRRPAEAPTGDHASVPEQMSVRRAWTLFGLASLVVVAGGFFLAYSADRIAEIAGVSGSFVGVVSVALVTTMPEATVTVAAMRAGAADLGVGNLYGSCVFNVLVLALADPFYTGGPLLDTMDSAHVVAALVAILVMTLVLGQVLLRGQRRWAPVAPTMVAVGLIYLGGVYAVFRLS